MRLVLAGAAIAVLAACGGGEADQRVRYRDRQVSACVAAARGSAAAARFDWPRLCRCAVDRYMAGKSAQELRAAGGSDPALRDATRQCAQEQAGARASL